MTLDIQKIRSHFPILNQTVHGKPLVYLDNAATTQKPQVVIDALTDYYTNYNSNIHRGVHHLSQIATDKYEQAREKIRTFINAPKTEEVILLRGTTEAINLVANTWGTQNIKQGDQIIITQMEHHSNIVPWQLLAQRTGATLKAIPVNDNGELILEEYKKLLNNKTKLVAVVHASNTLGTINPVKEITQLAHDAGAKVLIDGAQAVQHLKIDIQDIGCDFYTFSGHKLYAPTGIGVLWAKQQILEQMPPWQGGGDMILSVTLEKTIYNQIPYKFEAGTPNIADTIALGTAIDYINTIGIQNIAQYENQLYQYALEKLLPIPGLTLIGNAPHKTAVFSFKLEGIHPHDVGTILDLEGIAIRTGHMCTQPVMQRFGVPALSRISLAYYNTKHEIDLAARAINKVIEVFNS
ncbi:MAG: cysteine desulfurase [Ignavibacteria bacterium]|nr:cysteine desulfurase [Ignavibacteria bacterium]